jgi:hypothetical protein
MRKIIGLCVISVVFTLPSTWAFGSVQFEIGSNGPTGNHWELGTGWGTGSGQLDAVFNIDSSLPSQSFSLNAGGSKSVNFGSVQLRETTIDTNETDNLQVTGYLFFDSPPVGSVPNPGTAVAFTGSVSDLATDLKITFNPVTVNFGSGGKFKVDFSDLTFKGCESLCVSACITLVCEPTPPPTGSLPEPSTFVIWSLLGSVGLVFAWRKKKQ